VRITALARSAWDDLRREASYGTFIPNLGDVVPDGTAMTAAGPATLYRSADAPPRAAVTPLVPLGQSAPTPPPLPDVSGDDGTARFALIEGHSTVTIVATNCGPTGSNTYRTPDAFARVLDALIAYSES
jgi:hypothetical protein